MWSYSVYVLKVEQWTLLTDQMCDGKESAIKDDANYFGVNKWKDAIDIY